MLRARRTAARVRAPLAVDHPCLALRRPPLRNPALLVHPDKCSSPHAEVAFQRVQDGFNLLKGAPKLRACVAATLMPRFCHLQTRIRSAIMTIFLHKPRMHVPLAPPLVPTTATRGRRGLVLARAAERDDVDVSHALCVAHSGVASAWRTRRGSRLCVGARHHACRAHVRRQRALPRSAAALQHQRDGGIAAASVCGAVLNLALRPAAGPAQFLTPLWLRRHVAAARGAAVSGAAMSLHARTTQPPAAPGTSTSSRR